MKITWSYVFGAALAACLSGCVTAPAFESVPAASAPLPYTVVEAPERWMDHPVLWGGMILEVKNFERHTEIEMLAYPLDRKQAPRLELADEGRFIAILPGYVESRDYPAGRFMTLIGRITGERRGSLRNAPYVWPEVAVERQHLWPRDFREPKARFSIGVGVRL
jgi:outer membrane lipoprotein